jgi:hypothetical protein
MDSCSYDPDAPIREAAPKNMDRINEILKLTKQGMSMVDIMTELGIPRGSSSHYSMVLKRDYGIKAIRGKNKSNAGRKSIFK